jgi:hypothetical protein
MKTYIVRTRTDQTLVGMFCASSPRALSKLIEEAQFVQAPKSALAPEGTVFLTNSPEEYSEMPEDLVPQSDEMVSVPPGSALEHAMTEVIPLVLEPTEDLQRRFQSAQRQGWIAFSAKQAKKSAAIAPQTTTPILMLNSERTVH